MGGAHIERTADIFGRGAERLHVRLIEQLDLIISIVFLQMFAVGVFMGHIRGVETGMGHAGPEIAFNGMILDQGFDQILGLFR